MKASDLHKWKVYFEARNLGMGVEASARKSRIATTTAWRFERGDQSSTGLEAAATLGISVVAGNLVDQPLSKEAHRALADFAFFRVRYFGRTSTPWQERAAYEVLRQSEEARDTHTRRFIVMNEPPGSGKSTLFSHDIACWLIARDRTIRIQIGSRTERQARMYVGRIKRTLERDVPMRVDSHSLELGLAKDAEACLQDDYGAFKPEGRSDVWAANQLTARQTSGVSLDDKEPTVSAWGMDSGFLGGRFDLVLWDDLVDRKNTRTAESKDALREWWDSEAETRVEPGGVLILQGQRISPDDLYRYCLDKKNLDETPKYRHVIYKAHDDDNCKDEHDGRAKPWPHGCLLDPQRLPWEFLQANKRNNPRAYSIQYQQEDAHALGGLVDPSWLDGGLDAEGYKCPGCYDTERTLLDPPPHLLDGAGWSFITVDPSPTEWWGVIWWLYDATTNRRYIIDLYRKRMNPEDFLSLDLNTFEFSGLIERMRKQANDLRIPLRHVVVETNAAQRWLLSQPHVQRWMQVTGVVFVPHTTGVNKADPKFGVESVGDFFRQGLVRIPHKGVTTRTKVSDLVYELLRYPDSETTDMVMSTWFHTLAVNNHYTPNRQGALYSRGLPSFMGTERVQRGLAWAR